MKKLTLLALGALLAGTFAVAADMGGDMGKKDDNMTTEHKHQDGSACTCNHKKGEHAHKDEMKKDDMKKGDMKDDAKKETKPVM